MIVLEEIELNHVALNFSGKEKAETFFGKVLGLKKLKEFFINGEFAEKVFGINESVEIAVYGNEKTRFELFFTKHKAQKQKVQKQKAFNAQNNYSHVCITVPSIEELRKKCEQFNVHFFSVERENKMLFFMKDFSGNLYEIKEIVQ